MLESVIADRSDLWLGVEKTPTAAGCRVTFRLKSAAAYLLHWGFALRRPGRWQLPPPPWWPPQTRAFDLQAVQTAFAPADGEVRIELPIPEGSLPPYLVFVLYCPATRRWENNGGKDYYLALGQPPAPGDGLTERIIEGEMGPHGWTLFHRFNLASELIEQVGTARQGWVTLFVWLRFSALRQLTWQRNYNTKPRELAHAQERLTLRLASAWRAQPANRDLIRLALTGVGRGGDGQRIRDEILQIMHRHHIKEVGGTWMEQWHQKLHNNTTPDDIVICEAYLAFLQHHGDRERYFETLRAGGVTPARLAQFDRPITQEPEWHPQLRDALLHDFGHYLQLLKSVHSATDLETASRAASPLLGGPAREALDRLRQQFHDPQVPPTPLVAGLTRVRQELARGLESAAAAAVRELLGLDLALEELLRVVIERRLHAKLSGEQLGDLVDLVLENLRLGCDSEELEQCQREWRRLPASPRFTVDWSLHAKAALNRLSRALADRLDASYQELQPRAETLGRAFQADPWAIGLFAEEVVRGQPAFVLSLLNRHLDPILRQSADLGDWQVISPHAASGRLEVVHSLREIQGRTFAQPTLILAEKVHGDEEPPPNVRAVITPSSVDLVSHLAVRARNALLLFATCYDPAHFEQLRGLQGKTLDLKVTPAGEVIWTPASGLAHPHGGPSTAPLAVPRIRRALPASRVVRLPEFVPGVVGGKSLHLRTLSQKLPGWIHTPRSLALPFGVFDAVLEAPENLALAAHYRRLVEELGAGPEAKLAQLRQAVLELVLPEPLSVALQRLMQSEGLPLPADWNRALGSIQRVWASQWNDRAYFSRQARRFPHEALQMAVLIQEVVAAQYAFVLHTAHPLNGNRDELYAEVVLGLGETLVGNYPGRAFSFRYGKTAREAGVLAYPEKSVGWFGGGLIFRSDSNAEDLTGYAGAGLYDSCFLPPAQVRTLDYTRDALVWDESFRRGFTEQIAQLAGAVEAVLGGPQDIEGAVAEGEFFVVQSRPQVGL